MLIYQQLNKLRAGGKHYLVLIKKAVDHNNKSGNDRRESPYFKELNEIYGHRPNVTPVCTSSSSGLGDSSRTFAAINESIDTEEKIPNKKKRTYKSLSGESANKTVSWLEGYEETKNVLEKEKMERKEKQHDEKNEFIERYVK